MALSNRVAATLKLRWIERSVFPLLDHNEQTQMYRLVSGQPNDWFWRFHNFPTEDDDCPPPPPLAR